MGRGGTILSTEVAWPACGIVQRFSNVAPNQIIEITEGRDAIKTIKLPRVKLVAEAGEHRGQDGH